MSSDSKWFFEESDAYARRRYHCFVAELDLNEDKGEYRVCFRPIHAAPGSPDQYACRYIRIDLDDVKAAHTVPER